MNTPALHFIGWNAPAIELVANRLLTLNETAPATFRRATVVVPTAESGRRLREYMAERAGRPLLMPRITLAGQLIPTEGQNVASEAETVTAWLRTLHAGEYKNLLPHKEIFESESWLLDTITKLRNLRKRLEKENCTPEQVAEQLNRRIGKAENPASRRVLTEENSKWLEMSALFTAVDAELQRHNLLPRETARAAAVRAPRLPGNSPLLIIACVPEFSVQLQRFLANLQGNGTTDVQIWVNAPPEERYHFDEWGQALAAAWATRKIDIPHALEYDADGHVINEASTIHLTDDGDAAAAECVRLAHEALVHGNRPTASKPADEMVISCCDAAFTPRLHAAFSMAGGDTWQLNSPEGRSLLTMDAAHLFSRLADACKAFGDTPRFDEESGKVLHNNMAQPEAFCALLRNRALLHILPDTADRQTVTLGFRAHLESLLQSFLPGSVSRLLYLLNPQNKLPITRRDNTDQHHVLQERQAAYYRYALKAAGLVQSCCGATLPQQVLSRLQQGLMSLHTGEPMQKALRKLCTPLAELLSAPERGLNLLRHPLVALEFIQSQLERLAAGALPETKKEETELDVPGWKELPFYHGKRLIINGMHDGRVPEPLPGEELLPESLCAELGLQNNTHREARDAYLLTALLHSRRPGEVHFVLSRQSADGTPLCASTLLLRCGDTPEGLAQLAQRAHHLFADSTKVKLPPAPEFCPLRPGRSNTQEKINPGQMESVSQILREGERNPYAPTDGSTTERSFSPSSLAVFLECPLTFWIKNALQIDPSANHIDNKMEPESAEYGTGMHAVLDRLVAEFPSLAVLQARFPHCDTTEEWAPLVARRAEELADTLLSTAYADEGVFTLPMQARHATMKRTLESFARVHVAELRAGWCNVARELKVTPRMGLHDDNSGDTVAFNMTIDRVDYNTETREWRVLDYKTSQEAKEPRKVHYEIVPDGEQSVFHRFMNTGAQPDFPILTANSKKTACHYRWRNVQLPLYTYALQQLSTGAFLQLLSEQGLTLCPEMQQILAEKDAATPLLGEQLPEMGYCSLATKKQEVSYHSLMNNREICEPRLYFGFPTEPMLHFESAMRTVRSAARLIRSGLCLFSAVSLELRKKPFAEYGGLTPSADPRDIFDLPELNK